MQPTLHTVAEVNFQRLITSLDHVLSDCRLSAVASQRSRIKEEALSALQLRIQHMSSISIARSIFQMAADLESAHVLYDNDLRFAEMERLKTGLRDTGVQWNQLGLDICESTNESDEQPILPCGNRPLCIRGGPTNRMCDNPPVSCFLFP